MGNVKIFRSTDYGAPVLYGNAGCMIPVLDACLVNGYGQRTLATLVHSNGIVTATTSVIHGFGNYSRQTIEGANEAGYNGEFIISVIDGYTFTYQASGISINTATGTITAKSASAGWTKNYPGTNSCAYRQGGLVNKKYILFSDNQALSSRVVGYDDMTAVDTGTGLFPTGIQASGGLYWNKSTTADNTTPRSWIIIGDDRTFYMWVKVGDAWDYNSLYCFGFGDFTSTKPGDSYNQFIQADYGANSYSQSFFSCLTGTVSSVVQSSAFGIYGNRSYTQLGTSVSLGKIGDYSKATQAWMGQASGLFYPHPTDGGLYLCPVYIVEGGSVGAYSIIRGVMRGIWNPLHYNPLNHGDIFQGNGDLNGKTFINISVNGSSGLGQFLVDISLNW